MTNTRVLAVAMKGTRAIGLKLSTGTVHAQCEVLLCLGTFGSPQILMLSGIGPQDHLTAHGIRTRVDLPGVGATLYDHPNMPMQFGLLDEGLSMSRFQRLDRAVGMGLRYLLTRTGPGAAPFWSTVLFHALRDSNIPELEVYFTPMLVKEEAESSGWTIQNIFNLGRSVIARGKMAAPGLQIDINLLRPRSHGTVRLASTDPLDAPLIDPAYLSDPADMTDFIEGTRHMREVMRQIAFKGVLGPEISPGARIQSDAEIAKAVRELATTTHHPVSDVPHGGEQRSRCRARRDIAGARC